MPSLADIEAAFEAAASSRAEAVIDGAPTVRSGARAGVSLLALQHRLPVISNTRDDVTSGLLMAFGPDFSAMNRHAAVIVDKILKGAKPADLPVEQPTKFELVINLKTAKQIGVTIAPEVLARASRLIK